jgi:hypothetical protein
LSYRPRSSLPAKVLGWLAARLVHLVPSRPPGQGGTPPLSLEVRLDAVAAVVLDGLSYRRAGRAVGISKTEVGESMDLLLGPLAALGYCQPDGTFRGPGGANKTARFLVWRFLGIRVLIVTGIVVPFPQPGLAAKVIGAGNELQMMVRQSA